MDDLLEKVNENLGTWGIAWEELDWACTCVPNHIGGRAEVAPCRHQSWWWDWPSVNEVTVPWIRSSRQGMCSTQPMIALKREDHGGDEFHWYPINSAPLHLPGMLKSYYEKIGWSDLEWNDECPI